MASFFPRAVLFKEAREQFLWWILAAGILFVPALWAVLRGINAQMPWESHQILQQWIMNLVYGANATGSEAVDGYPVSSLFYGFLAAVLCMVIVGTERRQGALWYTLTTPVRRRELMRVKFVLGLSDLTVLVLALGLFASFVNQWQHLNVPPRTFGEWIVVNEMVVAAFYTTTFAVLQAVGSAIAGGIISVALTAVPGIVGRLLTSASRAQWMNPNSAAYWLSTGHVLERLSPAYYAGVRSAMGPVYDPQLHAQVMFLNPGMALHFWIVAAYLVYMIFCYFCAQWMFARAHLENYSRLFVFPRMWNWALVAPAIVVGGLLSQLMAVGNSVEDPAYFPRWGILALICWAGFVLIRLTVRRLGGKEGMA